MGNHQAFKSKISARKISAKLRGSLLLGSALSVLSFSAPPVMAQPAEAVPDNTGAAANSGSNDTIVVTGSRIRRSNLNTTIPVQVLGRGDIEEFGTVDVGEILAEIPGVSNGLSPESTNGSVQNAGLSTVNLRGLGGNRTLTLIDGRRAVSNSGNGERVSLQTVPAGFVESIEVTTGGASAIYGSDAIAGVANIILKKDFEGFEGNIRYGEAGRSGENEFTADFTAGKNFAGGRGNILVGFTYDNETAVFADQTRPESIAALEFDDPDNIGDFSDESLLPGCDNLADPANDPCINPTGSSFLPGGLFEGDDAWNIGGEWFNDQSLLPADGRTSSDAFEADVDGFNFRPGRTISPEVEVIAGGVRGRYELTPRVTGFVDVNFTRVNTSNTSAAANARNTTDIGPLGSLGDIGTISSSHPFIPPEVEETRSGSVSWRRRFSEVGLQVRDNERDTLRTAFGVNGKAGETWDWTVYGTYGRFEQNQVRTNGINFQNIQFALDIEADGAGDFQCVDVGARADGCVPLNIFGEGSISTAAADYIRVNGVLNQVREQTIFAASATGELFQLPAGPLAIAFGGEYRDENQVTVGDPDNAFELTSISVVPNLTAGFDVIEGFVEFDIPVVHTFSVQLAARVAEYSTIGTIVSYNAGGSWAPTEDIRFRGQYSRAQRAPSITEFFSAPRGDLDNLLDPCDGLLPDGTGITPPSIGGFDAATISANCLTEPGIQAFFADPVNAGNPFEFDDPVNGPNAGNDQLLEETANTFTVGVILTPSFIPNFSLVADYYNIQVNDAIGAISTQTIAELCYGAADFPNNRFCDVITRDASSGDVIEVINQQENLNNLKSAGIDITLDYNWEAQLLPGVFDVNIRYSRSFADEFVFLGDGGVPTLRDTNGSLFDPTHEMRSRVAWSHNGFRLSYILNYESGGIDDVDVPVDDPFFFQFEDQFYHNVFARYEFGEDRRATVYFGVSNLTNNLGPFVPSGFNSGNSRNIVSPQNQLVGRQFYGGVRLRF